MDFFATGGFQQLYHDLEEEPLAGGDALLNIVSVGELDSSYVDTSFPGGNYNQLEFQESDYYGIITLDSNNNTNPGGNVQVALPYGEDPSLFIDFNDLTVCPPDLSDWEQRLLDNYVEIPDLVDFLPERTPLCTDNCADFLEESNSNLRLSGPPPSEIFDPDRSSSSPDSSDPASPAEVAAPPPALQMSENAAGERGYLCTFGNCEKIYAKPAHLKAHLRRHLGEKPYVCSWPDCVWRFSRSDELARHKRSHSGVKPYKCDYCSKCFARSDHLTKHRKVHERRLLAASRAGRSLVSDDLYAVRPGRKRKNQL
ncbi:Krueppel-like factor 3 [Drosophila mauritiana]|uniref:Krueppel-like factor 3 n=1 Tax=Drosophila mauritiana TaxID=7226 RepID=A0A6P8KP75_DROMA|nr:Krueppel-like factor 3 [Drosophila mauritiana]